MRRLFPVTVHIFLVQNGQVLLLRRQNTGYMDGLFSVVAGHIDGEESARQAAIREAREEVGIRLHPEDLQFAGVMHRQEGDERVDFFFLVQSWQGLPENCEPAKCSELRWAALNKLPEATVPYVRQALHNYQLGVIFDEYGWDL